MALLDKVKQQAAQVAEKAQEAGRAGAARIGDVQAKRQFDALLRDLGAAVYAQRSERVADNASEVDALCEKLAEMEKEHGALGSEHGTED
jgi:phage host-nuclease inhibitor protein Gam